MVRVTKRPRAIAPWNVASLDSEPRIFKRRALPDPGKTLRPATDGERLKIEGLPRPPSVNRIWRIAQDRETGRSRQIASAGLKTWKDSCGWLTPASRLCRFDGPVIVTALVEPPRGRADIDNRLKAVLDLLRDKGVIADDSYPHVMEVRGRWAAGVAGLTIIVEAA